MLVLMFSYGGLAAAQFNDRFCAQVDGAGSTAFCENQTRGGSTITNNEITGERGILYLVVEYVTTATIVASILAIMVAGIMYITSDGEAAKATRARSAIIYAMIALAISVIVRSIVTFVLSRTGDALVG